MHPDRNKEDGLAAVCSAVLFLLTCLCNGYAYTAAGSMRKPGLFFSMFLFLSSTTELFLIGMREACGNKCETISVCLLMCTDAQVSTLPPSQTDVCTLKQTQIRKPSFLLSFLLRQQVVGEFNWVEVSLQLPN
ncbi:hypothetical protein ILYODFUR_022806 [Ilyodon furcidens]|uniref:Uncharacterized protein n=1 Tax=Ilyodon furcidens TaxID=33524 RepID=A0ABV0U7L9_9TELE